jgi:hypothetical protein
MERSSKYNTPSYINVDSPSLSKYGSNQTDIVHQNKFQDVYREISIANNLMKNRLERIKRESNLLKGVGRSFFPYQRDVDMSYNLRNMMNNRQGLMNPNLYANQYIEPIYYPLEMPINAEPITLPKIELGQPLIDPQENKGSGGFNLGDMLALMQAMKSMNGQNNQIQKMPSPAKLTPLPTPDNEEKKKKKPPVKPPQGKTVRNWWKLCKDFVNIYKFYSTSNKYGKHSNVRNPVINEMTKSILPHLDSIKNWVITCIGRFFEELKIFPDLNLQFHNHSGKLTIQGQSQKIMALLKILVIELAKRSNRINDVPEKIQELIYKYIREKAYYPKKFLSTFEINRLDFNFYGGTKNLSDAQLGLIVAFIILSKTTVLQILLHPKENFEQFKNFRYIELSCKYLGSILHYLTRDAFNASPPMVKELLALLNYYRNYHLFNDQVERQQDVFTNSMVFRDQDEIAKDLVPEGTITEFWNMNARWCTQMKTLIFQWAVNLARQIRIKYAKTDKNLEKKQIKKVKVEDES